MEDQLYRETLLEAARNPQNRGEIESPDLEAKMLNPLCGDEVRIQLKMKNEKLKIIDKAVFSGNGCAISQASASLLAEKIQGKSLYQIRKIDSGDIIDLIGIRPSPARLKCALLSLEVIMEALNKGKIQKTRLAGRQAKIKTTTQI